MRHAVFAGLIVVAACGGGAGGGGDDEPSPRDAEIHVVAGTTTSEAGATAEIGVSLGDAPTAPVVIAIQSDDPGEGAVSPATIRFETGDAGPHAVVVTGVDDTEIDGAQPYHVVFAAAVSDDAGYAGLIVPPVALTNTDDDVTMGTVRVFVDGQGAGVVTSTPAGIACPGTCEASFSAGTTVTLTAAAGTASRFGGWRMTDGSSFAATLAVEVAADARQQASARFVRDQLAWTTAVDGPAPERIDAIAAAGDQLVVGGAFEGPTTIGGTPLAHGGGRDPLIAAYATSDGAYRWSRGFGGSGDANVEALAILPDGDVIAGGWFTGELDLGGMVVTEPLGTGAFVARLAGADGAIVWAEAVPAGGPTGIVSAIGTTAAGGIVLCGSGAAPLARLDGDGGLIAAVTPSPMTGCATLDRRGGGWIAAGWAETPKRAAFASFDDIGQVTAASAFFESTEILLIDDVVAVPTGGAIVVLSSDLGGGVRKTWLVRIDEAGGYVASLAAGDSDFFGRSGAAVLESPDTLLLARRRIGSNIVLERYDIPNFVRSASFELEDNIVTSFDLAVAGDRTFLAGDSFGPEPLPGWPLTLDNDGGFVCELKLP